jgi:hypothetical protein
MFYIMGFKPRALHMLSQCSNWRLLTLCSLNSLEIYWTWFTKFPMRSSKVWYFKHSDFWLCLCGYTHTNTLFLHLATRNAFYAHEAGNYRETCHKFFILSNPSSVIILWVVGQLSGDTDLRAEWLLQALLSWWHLWKSTSHRCQPGPCIAPGLLLLWSGLFLTS